MKKKIEKCQTFLNIGALNCQGLRDKIDYPEVADLISTCDIFGVSESWLGENDKNCINVDNYTFYPLNRKKKKGEKGRPRGGIGIFVKNELQDVVKIRYDLSDENIIWCKINKTGFGYRDDVYIGFVYFPPESCSKKNENHFKKLEEITSRINSEHIITIGDYNARTKNLDDVLRGEKMKINTMLIFSHKLIQKEQIKIIL